MPSIPETSTTTAAATARDSAARADFLAALATHRHFLRFTARGLSDEQAGATPTVSRLCVGGLIKHVAEVESTWVDFILEGPIAMSRVYDAAGPDWGPEEYLKHFQMLPGETLAGHLAHYEEVARRTDEVVAAIPDLDASHPLPEAPWFEKGARWSARRVLLHIIAETAQHAGHADIIRETIDGARTMG